jgi:hypothetical protein
MGGAAAREKDFIKRERRLINNPGADSRGRRLKMGRAA